MKLSIVERLRLLEILPQQGDIGTLKIVRRLRETLSFSEEEVLEKGIVASVDGDKIRYKWDTEKEKPSVFEFKPVSFKIITDALKQANHRRQLPEQLISIYEELFGVTELKDE
jgi:hypothetical protein